QPFYYNFQHISRTYCDKKRQLLQQCNIFYKNITHIVEIIVY
ncbi:LytR family transcriptional regulator, partial [Bacillus nitratireducens]|nr:LytR family transcriptional regulator [Bacillus nitratireducens]